MLVVRKLALREPFTTSRFSVDRVVTAQFKKYAAPNERIGTFENGLAATVALPQLRCCGVLPTNRRALGGAREGSLIEQPIANVRQPTLHVDFAGGEHLGASAQLQQVVAVDDPAQLESSIARNGGADHAGEL